MQNVYSEKNETLLSRYAWKADKTTFKFGKKIKKQQRRYEIGVQMEKL